MDLLKKVVILLTLLAALISPISANGDMSGCPGGDCSGQDNGGSMSSETGATIVIETSGGYPGGYPSGDHPNGYSSGYPTGYLGGYPNGYTGAHYPGQQSSFTSGYRSPTSGDNSYFKTPFLGVLLTQFEGDSNRLIEVGTKLETLKQAEKVDGDKWNKLDELQKEINSIQKDLQQNIDKLNGRNDISVDSTYEP